MMKLVAVTMMLMALTACVPVIAPSVHDDLPTPSATLLPQEVSPMPQKPQILNATVSAAVRDLATRLGVSVDEVTVVEVDAVVWPDSSLGCPQPGALYMQVLQEGMRIRLQVGVQLYEYHSSVTRKPFLCENPSEPIEPSANAVPTKRSVGLPLDTQAIEDLAARLTISPQEIELVRMQEVDWPDGSLGCPQPGMRYKQVVINGTFIQLRVGDQVYNYHAGSNQVPFLCISKEEVVPQDLSQQ